MRRRIIFIALFIQIILASIALAQTAQVTNGLNYLNITQNADGSWLSGEEFTLTTEEAIQTLKILNQTGTANYTNALSWLQNQSLESTNAVAQRIYILSSAGTDGNALISYLDTLTKAWGGYNEYGVNNLDTALALQALKKINYTDLTVIQAAINYLLTNQNADGGWGFYSGDVSNVFMTASIVTTLSQFQAIYNLQNPINKGAAYLLANQNADGGFGSSPSTICETAMAMTALVASGVSFSTAAQPAINYLAASQSTNGSWADDPYTTALALRAFANFKPDMVITTSDITFSKPAPVAGDTINVTANVKNAGPSAAQNVLVRFYIGDPDKGGILIGEVVVPSIAAFGSAEATISWTIPSAFSGSIFVVVNPLNTIDELSRNNDRASISLTSATLPDLSISSADISFNPALPHASDTVILAANVRNAGETAASGVSVDFYDGDPNAGGTAIGGTVMSTIGAGSSVIASISGSFTNGNHAIYVVVDKANTIAEGSKTNNTAVKTLTVGGEGIDLSVSRSGISFSPVSPKVGASVTINATIQNLGDGTANNVEVAFYLGDPDNGGTVIGSSVYIPSLSGRGAKDVSVTWASTGHAGKNDIYVKVDPQNLIKEISKSNNQAAQTIVVLGDGGADLSISAGDIQFSAAQPDAGGPVVVSATVHNVGIQDAVNVPVEISLGDPQVGGTLIFGTQTIPSIPKGGSAAVQATLNTTGYAGVYEIYANVDPFNTIVETVKSNNLAHATIAIKEVAAPDLTVTAIDTTGVITDSQTLSISGSVVVTVKNKGNSSTATPFDITAFEDTDKNKKFDPSIDKVFGKVTYGNNLAAGATDTVSIPVSGAVLFKDNLLSVMVDSGNVIAELDETNNVMNTGQRCSSQPQVGTFDPVEKWRWTGSNILSTYNQVMMTPVVARITDNNGDGVIDDKDVPAIIFSTFQGRNFDSPGVLRAIRGDNGQEIFSISAPSLLVNPTGQIAVGDIDNDGYVEILVLSSDKRVLCFDHTGVLKWRSPQITYPPVLWGSMWGGPTIADIDNSGKPAIIIGSTVLNNNGTIRWQGSGSSGSTYAGTLPLVADINLDGIPEIIAGNTAYNNNGTILWQNTSVPSGYNAVGRFDKNDTYPQIVLVANGNIYLLDHNGQVKWGPVAILGGGTGGAPVVADFDGDGIPEIGVAGASRYIVLKGDGTLLWQTVTSDYSSQVTGSSVFDFTGEGKAKVIYNDEHYLRIYNGSDGRTLIAIPNSSNTAYEYPVIADVDNDNHAEIIVAANNYAWGTNTGIRVFGDSNNSWVNTRQIWNQHTYHITNVNDDGTIPRIEQNNWDKYNNYRCNVLTKNNALDTPDTTVSFITADMTGFPASVNLSARRGNGGATALPTGVDVSFYDGDPSSGGIFVGMTKTSKDIKPGEYVDVSIIWTGPSVGVHNIFVVADGTNKITECRKNNNTDIASLTVGSNAPPVVKLPDLTLSPVDIVITPPSLTDGQTAVINATIHNIGTLSATNINVSFYDGDPQNGGTLIGSNTIPNIVAGANALTAVSWNTYGQSGRNYIHVVIDPQNLIIESNKNNNSSLVALDVAIPTKPDLVITSSDITFSNSNPKAGAIVLANAAVHNLGTAVSNVEVSLYDGDPASGGTLITQKVIQQIIPAGGVVTLIFEVNTLGLSGTKSYFISVDPGNKIDEANKSNNIAWGTVSVMSASLNMSISTDKTSYAANDNIQMTVNIANLSSTNRSELLDVRITDSNGNAVAAVIAGQQISLGPNENKTLTFTWHTGASYTGGYKAVALLSETDTVIASAEAAFIISNNFSVSSKISTDKMSYNPTEAVAITSTVQSTTANMILNNLTAIVTLTGSGGTVLYTYSKVIPILAPGQMIALKSYWNTAATLPGSYTVRLDVFSGTTLLSTSMAGFAVSGTSTTVQGMQGTISAAPISVFQGKDVSLGYTVTNKGNEDIPLLNIKILIVDPVTQAIKTELGAQQAISKGTSIIGIGNINTAALIPGTYMAILRVATSAMAEFKTLSNATFEVKAGIEATKKISDAVNLLVWVNKKCPKPQNANHNHANCDDAHKDCMRIDLLEKTLKNAAVNYYIVYDKDDFQKQLRNPYYTDFMILGDQSPLEDRYNEELRELVYSGKGLISSLFLKHGEPDSPLLGIKFKGDLPENHQNIDFINSPIPAVSELDVEGKALRTEALTGAIVAAWIRPEGYDHHSFINNISQPNCKIEPNPAVVLNNYGVGKTIFFTFDLESTLGDANYTQIEALIKNSIVYLHKPLNNNLIQPQQLVPVEIQIKSLGGAFDLKIKETYPVQLKIFDPATNQWIADNPWIKDIHVESNETKFLRYYALTPDTSGTYALQTEIGYVENGAYKVYQNLNANITVNKDKAVLTDDIITALRALPVTVRDRSDVYRAINYIELVKYRNGHGSSKNVCQENIRNIIESIKELMEVHSCDTMSVRLMMDMLLRIYESKYYFW